MKNTKMLKKNYEFKNVLSGGKYYSGKYIESFIRKNNKKNNMLGIAISSKICKAVRRNAIKRLIRENYRLLENEIEIGYDIIFLWKKKASVEEATYKNINDDIKKIMTKADILKKIED